MHTRVRGVILLGLFLHPLVANIQALGSYGTWRGEPPVCLALSTFLSRALPMWPTWMSLIRSVRSGGHNGGSFIGQSSLTPQTSIPLARRCWLMQSRARLWQWRRRTPVDIDWRQNWTRPKDFWRTILRTVTCWKLYVQRYNPALILMVHLRE